MRALADARPSRARSPLPLPSTQTLAPLPPPPHARAEIDDYVFEPCGYSMNGVQRDGTFSTVHITPEDGFSYASFELCGHSPDEVNTGERRVWVGG